MVTMQFRDMWRKKCYQLPFPPFPSGNCSPRYMRSTMYAVPCTKDLLNGCRIPMGLVVQPLATVPAAEVGGAWEWKHGWAGHGNGNMGLWLVW